MHKDKARERTQLQSRPWRMWYKCQLLLLHWPVMNASTHVCAVLDVLCNK
jgi:hypothetical protein